MNINDLVTHYVAFRRTLGGRFNSTESILRSFCRTVGPRIHLRQIRVKAVAAFLAGTGPVTRAWHAKHSALKGLFRFAVSRGHLNKAPLPTEVPKLPPTVIPYIYSREELRRLLEAIPSCDRVRFSIEPPTLRAILLLLYGAGLRRGEVLNLSIADVDLPNGLLTIRDGKFFKSRLVPIGCHLTKVLNDYVRWRTATHPSASAVRHFFVGRRGTVIHRCSLQRAFKRLREHIGLRRTDGSRYQPRLHDLRHTFAVHRLTAWYRQGADVQRLVYHLSVYLGHVRLAHTQVYLTMTPELLQQAGTLFERYARRENNHA
jgi:site-specific recombinase XerD